MAGAVRKWDENLQEWVFTFAGPKGAPGEGLPPGGTTGQVAAKQSNDDYDTAWVDMTGGTGLPDSSAEPAGQGLLTDGAGDYDFKPVMPWVKVICNGDENTARPTADTDIRVEWIDSPVLPTEFVPEIDVWVVDSFDYSVPSPEAAPADRAVVTDGDDDFKLTTSPVVTSPGVKEILVFNFGELPQTRTDDTIYFELEEEL